MNSVEVRNVQKNYGKKEDKKIVLNGLNLTVAPSSIYTLIGASGCGKTTLLSCILGMKSLDSGSIKVLGHKVSYNKTSKVGHLIGFMPQNTALIRELTVNETLNYFGNIFLMKKQDLIERSQMIQELLELPSDDREIQHLSGGQQRRVSLAAAIIHNPLILILDEPTVGLDSILREKIWKFLLKSTRESNLSIIITTHYISEAQQSDRCGMMRDGILLAEDSPKNILTNYEAQDLDEAFLNLCLSKTKVPDEFECSPNVVQMVENVMEVRDIDDERPREMKESLLESFEKRKCFEWQTIFAISKKEYIRLKRQIAEFFFILILPILQILGLAYAVGGLPVGLRLGIVNNEVSNQSMCDYYLQQSGSYLNDNHDCVFNYASCHLLNEISEKDAVKIYYNTYEEAYHDAKRGNLMGVVSINPNISKKMTDIFETSDARSLDSLIDISLDQSDLQLTTFLQIRLFRAYENFNRKLMRNCSLNEKILSVPMDFSETINGSVDSDFKATIFPAVFLQVILFSAMGFSCFAVAQSRMDGVWNRTLLAGVRPIEVLTTQIIVCIAVLAVSLLEIGISSYLTLNIPIRGSVLLLSFFAIIACLTGSIFGIAISVITEDLKAISLLTLAVIQGTATLSGSYWPLEAQPTLLRYFSMSLPVTVPSLAVRNIAIRGLGIDDPVVQQGFMVFIAWMVYSIFFAYIALRNKRFSQK